MKGQIRLDLHTWGIIQQYKTSKKDSIVYLMEDSFTSWLFILRTTAWFIIQEKEAFISQPRFKQVQSFVTYFSEKHFFS